MTPQTPDKPAHEVPRRHRWCLLGILLVAAALRFQDLDQLGLTHFDEGAYALSAQSVVAGHGLDEGYPLQHYLAPPVIIGIGAVAMTVLPLPDDQALIAAVAFFGVLTVLLVYLMARSWFGPGASVGAASLVALSEFHVTFSRVGLTDVPFCFFFLLALWLLWTAEKRESWRMAIAAGIAIGLAWNTKYHGWLTGVIAGLALLPRLFAGDGRGFMQGAGRLAIATAVACALYLPWFLHITAQPGGYARLVEEHGRFLGPLGDCLPHLMTQGGAQLAMTQWFGALAPVLALALAIDRRGRFSDALIIALLAAIAWVAGVTVAMTPLALVGLWSLTRTRSHQGWLLLVLVAVFSVLTPFYHAYARLLLPWAIGMSLLAGVGIEHLARRARDREPPFRLAFVLATPVLYVLALLAWIAGPGLRTDTGFANAAAPFVDVEPAMPTYVIGEPAVVFYLRQNGRAVSHCDSFDDIIKRHAAGEQVLVISGRYARLKGEVTAFVSAHPKSTAWQATTPATVSLVRLLDDFPPSLARTRWEGNERAHGLDVVVLTLP